MNVSRNDLYRIVLEEYLLSEGRAGDDAAEELLKRILGDKYRPPEERDPARYAKHAGDTEPMKKPHTPEEEEGELTGVVDAGETMTVDDVPRPGMSAKDLASTIGELIHGRDPEEVSEIFQMAFEKIPGVELSSPGDEDYPGEETLYTPGAEGRPAAGFKLQELMSLIKEVLNENEWYDITAGERGAAHSTGDVEPLDLIQRIQKSYHDLQDAFEDLDDEQSQEIARSVLSQLETLMDTTEHPDDYRE